MLSGFVDIHHHLLYETDDGPTSFEQSLQMIQRAADQGVSCIAATPHVLPGHSEFNPEQHRQKLDALREYIYHQNLDMELRSGAEVLYTTATPHFIEERRIPVLGNSWHMLVEFHPNIHYDELRRAALTIGNMGFSIVLAHAERYRCLRVDGRAARLRMSFGTKIQLNSDAVILAHRRFGDRWIRRMLKNDLVDIIASDAHNTGARPCTLGDCARLLAEEYGEATAQRLCIKHPRDILNERSNPAREDTSEETET